MSTGRADYDQLVRFRSIPAGEPTFLIRGQDAVGEQAVRAYVQLAQSAGADPAFLELASTQADAMARWSVKKLPDIEVSEEERLRLTYVWGRRAWNRGALSAEAAAEQRGWNQALCAFELAHPLAPVLAAANAEVERLRAELADAEAARGEALAALRLAWPVVVHVAREARSA